MQTNTKYLTINNDTANGIVHLEWLTAPTPTELREGLNAGLEAVKKNKVSKWIGDVQHMGAIDPADQQWINTEWFPQLLGAGIKRMAVIVGNDIFNQMSVEDIMSNVESVGFVSQYFPDTASATKWLIEN